MWEAAMFAGHRGLGNLTVIVDRNRLQQGAGTENTNALEPLADKWRAFGWRVEGVDGHDPAALLAAFDAARAPRETPLCLIADTHKGRSEEHTSELQSLMRISYAVFCLKKTKNKHNDTNTKRQSN